MLYQFILRGAVVLQQKKLKKIGEDH